MNDTAERRSSPTKTNKKKSAIWKEFYENVTLHGLRNVFTSDNLVFRLAWLVLILVATSYLLYSVIMSFSRYFEYPTVVQYKEEMHDSQPLPAITICSENFADKYKTYLKDDDKDFQLYQLNISACAATAGVRGGRPCGHALVCAFISLDVLQGQPIVNCSSSYQNAMRQSLKKSNVTFDLLEFIYTFGESLADVLKECLYGMHGYDCSDSKQYKKTTKNERLCHTLNGDPNQDPYISYIHGSEGGITLLLKNRPDHYFYPRYIEGFTVYLHEQGAGLGDSEISAPPGQLTKISLQREKIISLNKKDRQCGTRYLQGYKTYTQIDCYNECISNSTRKHCGCRPALQGVYNDSITCFQEHDQCVKNSTGFASYDQCTCHPKCIVDGYKVSVTFGHLARRTLTGIKQMYPMEDYSEKDFLSIMIFYGAHRFGVYEEKYSFETTALFGEIGGNMGLLLGCSVITLAEFVFLFFSFLMTCFNRETKVMHTTNEYQDA